MPSPCLQLLARLNGIHRTTIGFVLDAKQKNPFWSFTQRARDDMNISAKYAATIKKQSVGKEKRMRQTEGPQKKELSLFLIWKFSAS